MHAFNADNIRRVEWSAEYKLYHNYTGVAMTCSFLKTCCFLPVTIKSFWSNCSFHHADMHIWPDFFSADTMVVTKGKKNTHTHKNTTTTTTWRNFYKISHHFNFKICFSSLKLCCCSIHSVHVAKICLWLRKSSSPVSTYFPVRAC